jgi:hypothetical protein
MACRRGLDKVRVVPNVDNRLITFVESLPVANDINVLLPEGAMELLPRAELRKFSYMAPPPNSEGSLLPTVVQLMPAEY